VRYNDEGGVTLFEVEGFGDGITYSEDELRTFDYYGVMASADGTGSFAIQSSEGTIRTAVRSSHADKKESAKANSFKKAVSQANRDEKKKAAEQAQKDAVDRHAKSRGNKCADCGGVYQTQVTFDLHVSRGVCLTHRLKAEEKSREAKKRQAGVERILEARRDERLTAEREEQAELKYCKFCFRNALDVEAITLLQNTGGKVVVKKVDRSRKELACRVLAKYFVICATTPDAVIGPSSAELKTALADASEDFPVEVKFEKPIPKMPVHGFARKPVVTRSRRKISKESVGWMEEFSQPPRSYC
jgi:hypothetical protein